MPVLPEVFLKALGDPEDPTKLAHVLARDHYLRIGLERSAQAGIERLCHGQHGHQTPPP